MENMTELTKKMYNAAMEIQSVAQAAEVLRERGQFRSLGDILRSYAGCENPKALLVDGLMANTPSASRDSVDKKVRNWLSGRTRTVSKQDAFVLSQVLGLDLAKADEFLKLVTGEGIHWRDPEEIIWGYAIANGLSYEKTCALLDRVKTGGRKPKNAPRPTPGSYTAEVREKLQPLLYGPEEALLAYLDQNSGALGAFHNTAYRLFMQYMELLESGGVEDFLDGDGKMSAQEILENYMYRRLVPVARREDAKDKNAFSAVQRSIRMNWPDETTISKMKSRELDVSRKVLILLFLATDGSESEYEELDEDEDILTQDEVFQNVYTRLNQMLHACGFQLLDTRGSFDWMILYCICAGDLWDMDQRLREILETLFPEGNENQ